MADLPYTVAWSRKAQETLSTYLKTIAKKQRARRLSDTIRVIHARLSLDPLEFGEIYRLRGSVAEHHAVRGGVWIDFAVDTKKQMVYVRTCNILSGPDPS